MKKKIKLKDNLKLKKVEGQSLLFIPDKGEFYKVNTTGTFILDAVKKGISTDKITKAMCKEFDIDADTATKDISDFISDLRKREALA